MRETGPSALRRLSLLAAIALLIIGTAPTAAAGDASSEYGLEVYLWGASIGGTSAAGEDLDISFEDLVDDLEMGFMGMFGARKAKWSFLADIIYLDVEDGESTTANVAGNSIQARGDVELTGWVSMLPAATTSFRRAAPCLMCLSACAIWIWRPTCPSISVTRRDPSPDPVVCGTAS